MNIRYDDRVAIVTGAGGGLGRCHALELARRGARVVVNDLGGQADGSGASSEAAREVVAEIEAAGGEAMVSGANVARYEEVEAMVAEAVERWGRVDILINNAGILRDKTFANGSLEDFRLVLEVHLMGTVHCTRACWEPMRSQGYGRVVVTTSSSGLYGNFGQANYGSAKMAVVGLMNTLAQEGAKYDIRVNALAPTAATRMTAGILPEKALALLSPETVTPAVLFLVSEDAPTRTILDAGAGAFAVTRLVESPSVWLPEAERTPEGIAAHWGAIASEEGARALDTGFEQSEKMLRAAAAGLGMTLDA